MGGVLVEGGNALSSLVTALTSVLSTDTIVANLALIIPVLAGVIGFTFIWRVIRRMVQGFGNNGKTKM